MKIANIVSAFPNFIVIFIKKIKLVFNLSISIINIEFLFFYFFINKIIIFIE